MSNKDITKKVKKSEPEDNDSKNTDASDKGNLRLVDEKNKPKKRRLFIAIIAVVLACSLSVAVYINWSYLSASSVSQWIKSDLLGIGQGDGYPVSIVGNTVYNNNLSPMGRYLAYISDTSFCILNSTAGEVSVSQHGFSMPAIKVASNRALIYDVGNMGYSVEGYNGTIYKGNAESEIFCGAIGQNGVFGLASKTSGYFSNVQFYNSSNEFLYSYKMSEYYTTSMAINPDGNNAAVAGVSTNEGELASAVYILDFSSKKPKKIFKFKDNMIFSTEYLSNGKIACIGDTQAYIIDAESGKYETFDYSGRVLTASKTDTEYGVALSLSPSTDGKNCTVVLIDTDGKTKFKSDSAQAITALDLSETAVVALAKGSIYQFGIDGKESGTFSCGADAKSIMIGINNIYVVGTYELRNINTSK